MSKRGQPDFGALAAKEVSASISDLGEIAARLGSILIYDKRGDVVDFDNFEAPVLRWQEVLVGDNSYQRFSSASARSGSQSLLLHAESIEEGAAGITKAFVPLGSRRVGIEISFSYLYPFDCDLFILLYYADGTTLYLAEVKFDPYAGKLYIWTDTGEYKEIAAPVSSYEALFTFKTIKLVVDFDTLKYERLLFDLNAYDISAYSIPEQAGDVTARYVVQIYIEARVETGGNGYIDDFILTQAEP